MNEELLKVKSFYEEIEFFGSFYNHKSFLFKILSFYLFLPDPVYFKNKKVNRIVLTAKNILTIPDSITEFNNVSKIYLTHNLLVNLPDNFGNLLNLKLLDISFNLIEKLPFSFINLALLSDFRACSNLIDSLPTGFEKLANLKILNLSNNKFTSIPENIFNLEGLVELDFSNNLIKSVSPKIQNLTHLKRLNLSGNLIEDIPIELLNLPRLKYLSLNNNPLSNESNEIITQLKTNYTSVSNYTNDSYKVEKDDDTTVVESRLQKGYIIPALLLILGLFNFATGKLNDLYFYVVLLTILFGYNLVFFDSSSSTYKKRRKIKAIKENLISNNEYLRSFELLSLFDVLNIFLLFLDIGTYFFINAVIYWRNNTENYTIFIAISGFIILPIWSIGLLIRLLLTIILRKKSRLRIFEIEKIPIKFFCDLLTLAFLTMFIAYVLL